MSGFELDTLLKKDSYLLAESKNCYLLLMNNSLFPWFIVVPVSNKTELYQLEVDVRHSLIQISDILSRFIIESLDADKLNIAAIGNIVSQLHVHVVGRYINDPCWPGVVWGTSNKTEYQDSEIQLIKDKIRLVLPTEYVIKTSKAK